MFLYSYNLQNMFRIILDTNKNHDVMNTKFEVGEISEPDTIILHYSIRKIKLLSSFCENDVILDKD